MYAEKVTTGSGNGQGYAVALSGNTINGNTYGFRLNAANYPQNNNIPQAGDYLRGQYTDFVRVESVTETNPVQNQWQAITDGQVSDTYLRTDGLPNDVPDLKFAYTINDLGWYSYKIVVKQNEQEYYNVYLPGILNGYPGQRLTEIQTGVDESGEPILEYGVANPFPNELDVTAHAVLFNDNINKVPRDIVEVGPSDKQYRSSVVLYGRVTNNMIPAFDSEGVQDGYTASNEQYFPRTNYTGKSALKHTATQIANARDIHMAWEDLSLDPDDDLNGGQTFGPQSVGQAYSGVKTYYAIETNPLIAKISTADKSIGWQNTLGQGSPEVPANMEPFLAIYETEPVVSELDIFWETASSGLIVDLNQAIDSFNTGAAGWGNFVWEFDETYTRGTAVTNGYFFPLDVEGNPFQVAPTVELLEVTNADNEIMPSTMFLLQEGTGPNVETYQLIYNGDGIFFSNTSFEKDVFKFKFRVTSDGVATELFLGGSQFGDGALANVAPSMVSIPDKVLTPLSEVIIPPISGSDNGSATLALEAQGLVYTFEFQGNEPLAGWPEWEINPYTGEITTEPKETPLGTYVIRLTVSDALGNQQGELPDYSSLSALQDIQVKVEPSRINSSLLNGYSCTIEPDSGVIARPPTTLVNRPVANVLNYCSGAFYLADSPLSMEDINNAGIPNFTLTEARFVRASDPTSNTEYDVLPNLVRLNAVGSGVHTEGTLQFEVNTVLKNRTNSFASEQEAGIRFFYRKKGATGWTPVKNNQVDLNNTPGDAEQGFKLGSSELLPSVRNGSPTTWKSDFPTGSLINYDNERIVGNLNQGATVFCQYTRAFNIEDMPNPEVGNEYLIILDSMFQGGAPAANFSYNATETLRAYCNYTDMHYPTCITRPAVQGYKNGVDVSDGRWSYNRDITKTLSTGDQITSYRYKVSGAGTESNNRTHSQDDSQLTRFLWADTPIGELVETFYTTAALTQAWVPPSASFPYINFSWEGDAYEYGAGLEFPSTPEKGIWANSMWYSQQPWDPYKEDPYNPARSFKLKFTGGFDATSGFRFKPNTPGIANTIQTSIRSDYNIGDNKGTYSDYGINRFMRVYLPTS